MTRIAILKGIIILLVAIAARAQTFVNFDQASRARIVWSEGLGRPRIAPRQVRTPALNFSSDPSGLVIRGDRQCTVVMHPGRPILLYVMWVKGKLAVLAGAFEYSPDSTNSDHTAYSPTLDHVDITGDCVAMETVAGRYPPDAQQFLFIGISGMPLPVATFLGTCVNSITSYSMGSVGQFAVQDFRGFVNFSEDTCSR